MSCLAFLKREISPSSATIVTADILAIPRRACSASMTARIRSKGPLALAGLSVAQSNQPLLTAIDVAFDISADYAPEGWQPEIAGFTAKSGRTPRLTLEARAGQLAGGREALKATGRAVVADALAPVDPVGSAAAQRETNWRSGYLTHFRRLVEAGLPSYSDARSIAEAGLASVHARMRWVPRACGIFCSAASSASLNGPQNSSSTSR